MTKVFLQPGLRGLSGGMGGWVYQMRNGKTVVGMKPLNTKPPTEAQLHQRQRFSDAASYAKTALADPAKRGFYEAIAKEREMPAFALAVSDYLHVPFFQPLDLSQYKGQVGDPILIRVVDNLGLVSVEVALNAIDGADIESGMAVEMGVRSGHWVYTAKTPVALGADIFIEVNGIDHTGKKVKMTENPIVGADE